MTDEKYNIIKIIMNLYYSNTNTNIFGEYVENKYTYESCKHCLDKIRKHYKFYLLRLEKKEFYVYYDEDPNYYLTIWYANFRELFPKIQKENGLDTFYKSYNCKYEIRDEELNQYN
jgi:hypothetical protein